ncbi:YicC/YloC family endoribonuclease [Hansschlegelia quercus]|uniref:YicC family protein n=1 Tax=Hansschlegelia quercus TaxID=2528245 RepID=A0A4Q9GMA5_9HYPH|nr:YicC/YloC family endoribonuclease [Hansschlegelia quercus]TBN54571.1 YicC family protein [Hansschlegelia quercus]
MPLASMTGFSRSAGGSARARWVWELRSVNSKGLDLRIRTPPGFDALEQAVRAEASARLKRGAIQASLTIDRVVGRTEIRINEAALSALVAAAAAIAEKLPSAAPLSVDAALSQRGIVEIAEAEDSAEERAAFEAEIVRGLVEALDALVVARAREGAALEILLLERVATIGELAARADACPARSADAVAKKLADQVSALVGTGVALDPNRLHQEAALLATRADIREELDRLSAHVEAARALIGEGGAVGRRLDFLAQEFSREANTLCAKSNDRALTAIGLDLKAVVEQFREQVQNVE